MVRGTINSVMVSMFTKDDIHITSEQCQSHHPLSGQVLSFHNFPEWFMSNVLYLTGATRVNVEVKRMNCYEKRCGGYAK